MPGIEEMTRVTGEHSMRQLQGLTKPGVIMFVVDINTDNTESQPQVPGSGLR